VHISGSIPVASIKINKCKYVDQWFDNELWLVSTYNGGYSMSKKVLSIIPAALFIFLIFVFTVVSAIFVLQGINFYHYLPVKMFAIAIFLTAIVSLLSFLKLRYWFPSLPLYIFFSTYISVQNLYLSNFIKSYLLILFFTALFQGSVYLVSIAVDIILAFDSDFDKFKLGAILDSCFGDIEKEKFFSSIKGFLVAILFQVALFICTHFIYELVPSFSLLFVLLLQEEFWYADTRVNNTLLKKNQL
jgi:hypothetical protein